MGTTITEVPLSGAPGTTPDLVSIDAIRIGERDRQVIDELDELAASIAAVGLLHPIVVTASLDLVAGGRRLEAIRELGWTHVPINVVSNVDQLLLAVREESGFGLGRLSPIGASIVRQQNVRALTRSGFLLARNAPTALYRFWSKDDTLLYVGISRSPEARRRDHMRKAWWPDVAHGSFKWFRTRSEALQAEARAIRDEGPLHNIQQPRVI
jgi:hypothetical protein